MMLITGGVLVVYTFLSYLWSFCEVCEIPAPSSSALPFLSLYFIPFCPFVPP